MNCAATYTYNDADFREIFPALDNPTLYPAKILQMYWDQAGTIIKNTTYGFLAQQSGAMPMNLMTAHLAAIGRLIASGQSPSLPSAATIDKVSVTLVPPPTKDMFDWWLATTPYGQQLLAMLSMAAVGGLYAPGSLGRQGFFASGANDYGGYW